MAACVELNPEDILSLTFLKEKEMKITAIVLIFTMLGLAPAAFASDVKCPEHGYASCYNTGSVRTAADGHLLKLYHCTCGDEWWVRE